MKHLLAAIVLSVGAMPAAHAQSLDIGGIELHLGQKVDDALRLLSPYDVQYRDGSWIVTQQVGSLHQVLGVMGATSNAVSYISKSFELNSNERASEVYTRASKEVRRRSGVNACVTREVDLTSMRDPSAAGDTCTATSSTKPNHNERTLASMRPVAGS